MVRWGDEPEPTYRPWGHNPHLDSWPKSSEAWLDYWQQHRNDEAESDDGRDVVVKKHKRKGSKR